AVAMRHLLDDGKVLGLGHAEEPQSLYNNPQLYPQAFPWLFPYGLGGLSNENGFKKIGEAMRKKMLLMYYDKRFQLEPHFSLVALNQEQIKQSTTGGYLLARRANFPKIADRLLNIDATVLDDLIKRMERGDNTLPQTDAERECYQIINDLDHVAHKVQGSRTNSKYKRNEIWALTSYLGAPSWFITFAPADVKHPIALYYAGKNTNIFPQFYSDSDRYRLIANNPVACARFFKLMVELFIKHVLGVGTDHSGLYGKTAGYYGTVEQ
ncbi:hypothetical protein BV25DRAFT_1784390, partial [Artomyces pyxidatus]